MTALAEVPRETVEDPGTVVLQIPVGQVDIGPNVRVNVDGIDELAASIAEHGLKQPIKVRPDGGRWVVVWGQRRLLAHRLAGIERIPALVADETYTAGSLAIEQLVENLHRADLPPLDRARAMRAVVDAGTSQADLARELGLAPSTIANDLGLLEAPPAIQKSIESGQLTPAHAKALKGLAPKTQVELANQAISRGASAHDTERLVQDHKQSEEWRQKRQRDEEKAAREAVERLTDQLGNLAKKKVAFDAPIVVVSWEGSRQDALVERIQALGYTNVTQGRTHAVASRTAALGCDCGIWRVELDYGRPQIVPGCKDVHHQAAKQRANDEKRNAKDAVERSVHAELERSGSVLVGELVGGGVSMDPLTARMALWHTLDYRLGEWSTAHGGTSSNPWKVIAALTNEQLRVELGKALAKSFRDRYGYHVPWGDLAIELGIAPAAETPA